MMVKKQLQPKRRSAEMKRCHKLSLAFNESEMKVIAHYVRKYKINNRSKLLREAIISHMLIQLEKDHPTLF